jgi:hypothetical protein
MARVARRQDNPDRSICIRPQIGMVDYDSMCVIRQANLEDSCYLFHLRHTTHEY